MITAIKDAKRLKKGSDPMKYRPMTKEERSTSDPLEARDLRRQICKEINDMDVRALQNVLWTIQKRKR